MPSTTSLTLLVFVLITILQPHIGTCDFLSPLLSPVIGDFCKEVGCGRGKCKMSDNSDFQYECECDPGWKQTLSNNASSNLKFLPCVIPNCTLDYSCTEAAPPVQSQEPPQEPSIFKPCGWAHCGAGLCNNTTALTYKCECLDGYYNLFNNTMFPCFKECSIGGNCPNLGIPISNQSTPAAPNLPDTGSSKGSLQFKVFRGMLFVAICIALGL